MVCVNQKHAGKAELPLDPLDWGFLSALRFNLRQQQTDNGVTSGISALLGNGGQVTKQVALITRAVAARGDQREVIKPPRKPCQVAGSVRSLLEHCQRTQPRLAGSVKIN